MRALTPVRLPGVSALPAASADYRGASMAKDDGTGWYCNGADWSQVDHRMPTSWSLTAGDGLSGGGDGSANRFVQLGTPGTISGTSTNSVSVGSHTHALSANLKAWDAVAPTGYVLKAGDTMTGQLTVPSFASTGVADVQSRLRVRNFTTEPANPTSGEWLTMMMQGGSAGSRIFAYDYGASAYMPMLYQGTTHTWNNGSASVMSLANNGDLTATRFAAINGAAMGADSYAALSVNGGVKATGANATIAWLGRDNANQVWHLYANAGAGRYWNGAAGDVWSNAYGSLDMIYNGVQRVVKNNGAIGSGTYSNGHIEMRTTDASYPSIGFHRSGADAAAIWFGGGNSAGGNSSLFKYVDNGGNQGVFILGTSDGRAVAPGGYFKTAQPFCVLSATSGNIYLRPLGEDNPSGQVVLNSSGIMSFDSGTMQVGSSAGSYAQYRYDGARSLNGAAFVRMPTIFVQSGDPGSAAQTGDIWIQTA